MEISRRPEEGHLTFSECVQVGFPGSAQRPRQDPDPFSASGLYSHYVGS